MIAQTGRDVAAPGKYYLAALSAIVVLALFLRIAAVALFGIRDIVSYSESGIIAQNFVSGSGYTFDFYGLRPAAPLQAFIPPTYTALVALMLRFAPDPALALELTQAFISVVALLFVHQIARQLANSTVALYTAVGLAVYPVFVILPAYPISLTLNTFFDALVILQFMQLADKPIARRAVITGISLGLAILTKPQLELLAPFLLMWLWLNGGGRRTLRAAAVVTAVALCTVLPWTLRNYVVLRQVVPISTNGGFTFWNGNNPFTTGSGLDVSSARLEAYLAAPHDPRQPEVVSMTARYPMPREIADQVATMDEETLERSLYAAGFNFIRTNPQRALELLWTKFSGFWWFHPNVGAQYEASWTRYYQFVYAALVVFALPGLLLSFASWRRYAILYWLITSYCIVTVLFQVQTRYRWDVEPFFVFFGAMAFYSLLARVRAAITPAPAHERYQTP